MKAYELMNALSEVNAGAAVRVSFSMTKDMFLECESRAIRKAPIRNGVGANLKNQFKCNTGGENVNRN